MSETAVIPTPKADPVRELLERLVNATNGTIESHKASLRAMHEGLKGHETDIQKTFDTLKNHADAVTVLREDMERLGHLVNAQSTLISALQSTMLRVVDYLGLADSATTYKN